MKKSQLSTGLIVFFIIVVAIIGLIFLIKSKAPDVNVCNIKDASSTEFKSDCLSPVIDIMENQKHTLAKGGTMRLGIYPAILKSDSRIRNIYGVDNISERHRHRYEVNNNYRAVLENNGLIFSGVSPDNNLMEFLELPNHRFFIATQAHPEFLSRPLKPHPLFLEFVKSCIGEEIVSEIMSNPPTTDLELLENF